MTKISFKYGAINSGVVVILVNIARIYNDVKAKSLA
jgi:hypothetical protein